jgi:hypothetical protein
VYYGNKPNTNFFQFYGFVIENNENDEVQFALGLDSKDPLKSAKESLLESESCFRKVLVSATTEDAKFARLISNLRYVTYEGTPEGLKQVG